jgi:hypothetical protein
MEVRAVNWDKIVEHATESAVRNHCDVFIYQDFGKPAKLAKRLGWTETVKRCHQLARNLEASAKEYREMRG